MKKLLIIISFLNISLSVYSQVDPKTLSIQLDDSISMDFIKIDSLDIWIGKYEVTNQQYEKFMRYRDGSHIMGVDLGQPDQPAVFLSYCDAEGFMYWINTNADLPDGLTARLPSGQEWNYLLSEYQDQNYPWGNTWPPTEGNYLDQSSYDALKWEWYIESYNDGFNVSAPVHSTHKNKMGIHGLMDNVREWTSEKSEKDGWYYIRGASWRDSKPEFLETKYKVAGAKWGKDNHIGFRVVLVKTED
jgi:formylglycine-generating enzyme required for sulfatase activity